MRKLLNTLYVTNPEAFLSKEENNLVVKVDGQKAMKVPFHILENVILFGYLGCSPAVLGKCADEGISLAFVDGRGRFLARVEGSTSGNVLLRREQYRRSDDIEESLVLAQRFIAAKIHNSKIVLQRFKRDYPHEIDSTFESLLHAVSSAEQKVFLTRNLDTLRGVEGDAAHSYFSTFSKVIRVKEISEEFQGRVRRPPEDPVNALLSFFYTILASDVVSACETVGLDPQVGFLHRDRPGRASLALDIIEELRAYCVDRFVLSLVNRQQVTMAGFQAREDGAVVLRDEKRKEILGLWQERKKEQITHPFLGEKIAVGLLPYVQTQLLARYLRGDLDDYPAFLWR
ncbi:MAG: type I-C CRISPR-associated endonuclease Cas1c [Raoultibacter sp.]|jgi:CRISPR-associated protein Cas1